MKHLSKNFENEENLLKGMSSSTLKRIVGLTILFLLCIPYCYAQVLVIKGKVIDSSNDPVIGAAVQVSGSTNGTITDMDGNYTLSNVQSKGSLLFSYVGMVSQKVQVDGRKIINVVLKEDNVLLEETVVIGYQTVKKKDLTGAVSVIKTDDFKNKTNLSIGDALQGTASGVSVRSSGEIGSTPTIQIRGTANLTNNDPLYVIDGMPTSNDVNFNVNDIESIQVLKDASAAAIYGSRAANGVVIITTKQGREGKTRYEFNSQISVNWLPRLDMAHATEWKKYYDDAFDNAIALGVEGVTQRMDHWNNDTDWQSEFFKTGVTQNYDFSFSGGGKGGSYRSSFNYLDNSGTTLGRNLSRLTARLNSNGKLGIFNIGESLQVGKTDIKNIGGSMTSVIRMIPTVPVYDSSSYGTTNGYGRGSLTNARTLGSNPVADANNGDNRTESLFIRGTAFAEAQIFSFLKYKLNLGTDISDNETNTWRTGYATNLNGSDSNSSASDSGSRTITYLVENTFTFDKKFSKHNINAVIGNSYQNTTYRTYSASNQKLIQTANGDFLSTVSSGTAEAAASGYKYRAALVSYLGRINYDFDGKYLLSLTGRIDGSSRFSKGNRWGIFPSASLGWRISKEKFFKIDWIDDLKFRANYGNLGSQNVGYYDYQMYINSNPQYLFNGTTATQGQIVTKLSNTDLSWETLEQTNIGMDVAFLKNRLQVSAEYYISKSHDVLTALPILMTTGNSGGNPYVNAASIQNKGFEVTATWRNQVSKDFSYSISGNISHSNNKLLKFGYGKDSEYTNRCVTEVGEPIGMYYLIQTDGIFKSDEEANAYVNSTGEKIQPNAGGGDVKFIDANADGKITTDDRVVCGSPWPDFEYGVNLSATYKNFEFNLAGYGKQGGKIYDDTRRYMSIFQDCAAAYAGYDYWTPTNTNSSNPRLIYGDSRNTPDYMDRWLESASFFRISTLSAAYNWKPEFLHGIVDNVRLSLTAQNLITLTSYKGYDPDFQGSLFEPGVDYSSYASPKSVIFSLNIKF